MLTEVQYKEFDELLESVKIDMRTYDLESSIDPQQLIKVAMKVNYDLGLKVNPSRSKAIEIHKGKGKLPQDFYVLNFALVCEGHNAYYLQERAKTYTEGMLEGVLLAQKMFKLTGGSNVRQFSVIRNIVPGINVITHNVGTANVIVQALSVDGNLLSFEIHHLDNNSFELISDSHEVITEVRIVVMGGNTIATTSGGTSAEIVSDANGKKVVAYNLNGRRYEHSQLIPLRIEKSKSVSADCFNIDSHDPNVAHIKNGFLVTNFDEGVVYINYQSLMEDDKGNLLVMEHPLVNEYYEYALKQRIYENLYMSGENVLNYLQLVEQKLRAARNNALSFINTPDFRELKKTWELNRKAQYHNYYNMFKSRI